MGDKVKNPWPEVQSIPDKQISNQEGLNSWDRLLKTGITLLLVYGMEDN